MLGKFIGVSEEVSVFEVKKEIQIDKIEETILKATALGVYFVEVNGVRVGNEYMAPGWTSYKKLLQYQTYDITNLLKLGKNQIKFTVGTGWYASGVVSIRYKYGEKTAICSDIEINGIVTCSTDETWKASESYIKFSGIYDGELQDFVSNCKDLTVKTVDYDKKNLIEQISEPVRTIEKITAKSVTKVGENEFVYDFNQNLTGVVEIIPPKNFKGKIEIKYAELFYNGIFYTENLRDAKATDEFILDGERTLSPEFTFHGFRYVKIKGVELPLDSVTALVRHTDMKKTGVLTTSNIKLQRLFDNAVWSQRDNFFDVPTDCPQRDERLGWTGDANVFCMTASYNYDVRKIFKKWLACCRVDQNEYGEMPVIVPNVLQCFGIQAIWGDSIIMIPYKLYKTYADRSFLEENYTAMKKYVNAHDNYMENGLIVKGDQYGDWLALDKDPLYKVCYEGSTDKYYIANVCYYHNLKLLEEISALLGDKQYNKEITLKSSQLLKRIREEYFTQSGRLAFDTVTSQVLALCFNIVKEENRNKLAKKLNENIINHEYRITTGFIGTPYLLFALTDNGYYETACKILLSEEYPSWLYEVKMGATTIWERWNSLLPDGTPNPAVEMNSYNHYAYGSVLEFVYRRIIGLEKLEEGFKKIKISPMPIKGISDLKVEFESVNGKIIIGYRIENCKCYYDITVPKDIKADIIIQNEEVIQNGNGDFHFESDQF